MDGGLSKNRTMKRYLKIIERIGRIREQYSSVAQYFDVTVDADEAGELATAIHWRRLAAREQTYPGVYCLQTNQADRDERQL